jgi:hypothetical protein
VAATQGRPAEARPNKRQDEDSAASRDREFRRLWALIGRRAKRAGITPEDVEREIEAHRAGR